MTFSPTRFVPTSPTATASAVPRVPADMFRFTQGDRSELYSAILQTFAEANERLETALVLDDIQPRVGVAGWMAGLAEDDIGRADRAPTCCLLRQGSPLFGTKCELPERTSAW
ncbi:MAG: hypothetical protein ABJA16_11205 [Nakamurella sp.]